MTDLAFSRRHLLASVLLLLMLNCFTDHLKSEALVLEEEFSGQIVTELKVNLPAEEVWAVYRLHNLQTVLMELNPDFIKRIDYINGDGGVGSFVNLTTQPEVGGVYYLDEIIAIDDTTKTRITRGVAGEYTDLGFTLVESNQRIIEQGNNACIVRLIMSFKLRQDSLGNMSRALLLRANWLPANQLVDYVNSLRSTSLVLHKKFKAEIVTEMEVNLPANEIWEVFRSKDFGHLLFQLFPSYYQQIEYLTGDGGVDTVLNITLQPEFGGSNWLDEVIEIDDETKTILFQRIEGGVLNSGFTEFLSGYQIIEKAKESCVIREFTPFKIKAESVIANASSLTPNWNTARAIADYVNSI